MRLRSRNDVNSGFFGLDNAATSSLRANGSAQSADPLAPRNGGYKRVITRRINCGKPVDDLVEKPLDFPCKSSGEYVENPDMSLWIML
jgi:hypothetical protein